MIQFALTTGAALALAAMLHAGGSVMLPASGWAGDCAGAGDQATESGGCIHPQISAGDTDTEDGGTVSSDDDGTVSEPTEGAVYNSDRRLKRDIRLLTTLDSGIRLYAFRYLWSDTDYVGVMAQDLLEDARYADAARMTASGYYVVDYARLGLRMATLEAWRDHGVDAVSLRAVPSGLETSALVPLR